MDDSDWFGGTSAAISPLLDAMPLKSLAKLASGFDAVALESMLQSARFNRSSGKFPMTAVRRYLQTNDIHRLAINCASFCHSPSR